MARASQSPRLITEAEAAVIERALTAEGLGTDSMLASVRSLFVVDRCGCGCASVDFAVPSSNTQPTVPLVDATGKSPSGEDLGIIIWTSAGSISGLEVFGYTDEPAPLPVVSSIKSCFGGDTGAA
jgi:hypothetical protein